MRAIVISNEKFPRGSAGANYIQYFAKSLIHAGFKVLVLGVNEGTVESDYEMRGVHQGIDYLNRPYISNIREKLYFDSKFYSDTADKFGFNDLDFFFFYNTNPFLFSFFRKKYLNSRMYLIRVEDLQPCQFRFGMLNPRYILEKIAILYAYKNMNGTISITTHLARQDRGHGCRSLVLPIMANPYEFQYCSEKKKGHIVNFIYPGLKTTGFEDDLSLAFRSFAQLPKEILSCVKIHITGCCENKVLKSISKDVYSVLRENIIIHGFLEYQDIVSLYKRMDYLVLIRKVNKITKANFPSKVPETMGFGIIPICTDVGDYTKYYLNESNALIIRNNTLEECVDILFDAILMAEDQYKTMRESARRTVIEKFYFKNWSRKLTDFLFENQIYEVDK